MLGSRSDEHRQRLQDFFIEKKEQRLQTLTFARISWSELSVEQKTLLTGSKETSVKTWWHLATTIRNIGDCLGELMIMVWLLQLSSRKLKPLTDRCQQGLCGDRLADLCLCCTLVFNQHAHIMWVRSKDMHWHGINFYEVSSSLWVNLGHALVVEPGWFCGVIWTGGDRRMVSGHWWGHWGCWQWG